MHVSVHINLEQGETATMTAQEAADAIAAALNLDPAKDTLQVQANNPPVVAEMSGS
jgi:hypothetical protein